MKTYFMVTDNELVFSTFNRNDAIKKFERITKLYEETSKLTDAFISKESSLYEIDSEMLNIFPLEELYQVGLSRINYYARYNMRRQSFTTRSEAEKRAYEYLKYLYWSGCDEDADVKEGLADCNDFPRPDNVEHWAGEIKAFYVVTKRCEPRVYAYAE